MSRYLISTCETYRVDSEAEAASTIEEAKNNMDFVLAKYTNEYKERKLKGEVVDAYYKLTLTKQFTDIKDPEVRASVSYDVDSYIGPSLDALNDNDMEDEEYDA